MPRLACLIASGLLALTAAPVPAAADRWPAFSTRKAMLGCWDVGEGATLQLSAKNKHGTRYALRFDREVRGRQRPTGTASWIRDERELDVQCRPDSQHGSFCRVAPTRGGLRVRVFVVRHGRPDIGELAEIRIATRVPCR
jgi:hypothetical protein